MTTIVSSSRWPAASAAASSRAGSRRAAARASSPSSVNTGDDFVHLGLHISPDLDSVLYALADLERPERGWGLAGETWISWGAGAARRRDLVPARRPRPGDACAAHRRRWRPARTLSEVTALLARRLGIAHAVVPMSDDAGAQHRRDRRRRARLPGLFRAAAMRAGVSRRHVSRAPRRAQPSAGVRDALDRAQRDRDRAVQSVRQHRSDPGVAGRQGRAAPVAARRSSRCRRSSAARRSRVRSPR